MSVNAGNGVNASGILFDDALLFEEKDSKMPCVREDLANSITLHLTPLSSDKRVRNLLLYGKRGNGKTTVIKRVIEKLKPITRIKCVYVNCWRYYTRMAVYSRIARELGAIIPRRGLATDEVFDQLVEVLKKTGQKVVVFLDEVDGLIFNHQQRLLYELTENYGGKQLFCFVGVCDHPLGFNELDERVKSPLFLSEVNVPCFNLDERVRILEEKASHAMKTSYSKEALEACFDTSVNSNSSIETALFLLLKAALACQKRGKTKMSGSDVKNEVLAVTEITPKHLDVSLLTPEERLLVSILRKGAVKSAAVYRRFRAKIKLSKKQVRNHLRMLVGKKIICISDDAESRRRIKPKLVCLNPYFV